MEPGDHTAPNLSQAKPKLSLSEMDLTDYMRVITKAMNTLRSEGRHSDVLTYYREATAGNYTNMIKVTRKWFDVK